MSILLKPIITEKSMINAARGVFTFHVALSANKNQVKEAVEKLFNVTVEGVQTTTVHTPVARTGKLRIMSERPSRKFARVTLKKGQTIALFDLKEQE